MEEDVRPSLRPFENLVQFDIAVYWTVFRLGELWRRYGTGADDNM